MIESLRSYSTGRELDADLCVVGAGPAGMALAREFLGTDVRVALLESGGETPEPDSQALNRGRVTGMPYLGLEAGRVRAFGGTSWTWFGQCLPLGPEALERRPWVPDTGWPIGREELHSYYARAARFFDIDPRSWRVDIRHAFGIEVPQVDNSLLETRGPVLTAQPKLGPRYADDFRRSSHVLVLLDATVVALRLSFSGQALTGADVSTLDGRTARVRAKAFVLAAGAIENARLLMMCPGLQARLPALGRYLQDHPSGVVASVQPPRRRDFHDLFAVYRRSGQRFGLRLRLADEVRRRVRLLACEGALVWPVPPGVAAIGRLAARDQGLGATLSDVSKVLIDGREVLSAARRYRRGLSSAPLNAPVSLVLHCEQAPDASSRLRLIGESDPLGVPQVCVDWRVGELEHRAMTTMTDVVAAEFRRLGLGVVRAEEWLGQTDEWRRHVHDTYHPAGSTRMGADVAKSVVDSHCQVHGLENVFVAGSSVFPSTGAANPTLTIVAMALRLADRLKTSVFA